jgi:putative IMPACT (imprinted ancient) family translation regulator
MEALDGYEAVCEAPYTLVGKLQYLARQQEVPELSIEYGAAVTFTWFLTPEKRDAFEEAVRDLSGGALTLAINKSRWYNS